MRADTRRISVVANPVGAADESEALRSVLEAQGIHFEWSETTEDDPGRGQAAEALDRGADIVVACGGDGTVRACIEALAGTDKTLAVVPAGTGNLLARNLGIPQEIEDAVACLTTAHLRTIDVGYLNDEAFAVMAGAGLDAVVMKDTPREAKNRFGAAAYAITALRHLYDGTFGVDLTLDGTEVYTGPAVTVLIGNMGELQGGIDLFPDADPHDGALGVMAVNPSGLVDWLRTGYAVIRGESHTATLDRWRAGEGEIVLDRPRPYQIDGEERPATDRLRFRVAPSALSVCIPEEER